MKLAIDLGGTNLRIGQIESGCIVSQRSIPCPSADGEQVVIDAIKLLIREMMTGDVDSIGIGVPSVVDVAKGIVYNVVNIPSWKEVHLKNILEDEFGVKVCLDNDVNCFTLGEKYFGEGKAFDDIVGVTLGTGVGAGIIIGGQLYRGSNTGAGEVGSLSYLQSDYEHYCSSPFFECCYNKTGKVLTNEATSGDNDALDIWCQFGFHLGKLMQVILYTYDPQAIIIGGGISKAAYYFSEAMYKSMYDGFPYKRTLDRVTICFSKLLCSSNLLGATKL